MENKRLIVLFASIFSIVFSIFYYVLFQVTLQEDTAKQKRTLYMNQVGLYKNDESVNKMVETLKSAGFIGYQLKQDALTAVVCSVGTDEKQIKKDQETLTQLKYSYIEKSVTVEDGDIVKLIDNKEYDKALERIGK